MRVRSFAKINLGLEILGKRPDNYHNIRTLFQTVDLYDLLDYCWVPENRITLSGTGTTVTWDEDNLIYKAAVLLKQRMAQKQGIDIRVEKNIPVGGGMGGGSSNAAITLWALNQAWGLELEQADLKQMARRIGADVPYFLDGGLCLGTGRGDEIQPLSDLPQTWCLLIFPAISVSTAAMYANFRKCLTSNDKDSRILKFLDNPDPSELENDLEETVFRTYPQIKAIKRCIQSYKPGLSLVSGSGSTVFALFDKRENAVKAFEEMHSGHDVRLVEILSRSQYWDSVGAGV